MPGLQPAKQRTLGDPNFERSLEIETARPCALLDSVTKCEYAMIERKRRDRIFGRFIDPNRFGGAFRTEFPNLDWISQVHDFELSKQGQVLANSGRTYHNQFFF